MTGCRIATAVKRRDGDPIVKGQNRDPAGKDRQLRPADVRPFSGFPSVAAPPALLQSLKQRFIHYIALFPQDIKRNRPCVHRHMACFVLPPTYFTAYFLAYSRNRRSYSSLFSLPLRSVSWMFRLCWDISMTLPAILEQWSEVRSRSVSRSAHTKPASMLHLPSRIRRM